MIQPGRQDALAWQINKLGLWGKISHLPTWATAFWAERVHRVHLLVPGIRAIVNVNHCIHIYIHTYIHTCRWGCHWSQAGLNKSSECEIQDHQVWAIVLHNGSLYLAGAGYICAVCKNSPLACQQVQQHVFQSLGHPRLWNTNWLVLWQVMDSGQRLQLCKYYQTLTCRLATWWTPLGGTSHHSAYHLGTNHRKKKSNKLHQMKRITRCSI